eukprot:COSAG02_NODE_11070_length_1801_cov_1.091657_3_plen_121_part_00
MGWADPVKQIVSQAGKESKGLSTQVQRAVGLAAELLCRLVKAEEERDVFVKAQLASLRALVRRGLLLGLAAAVLPDDDAPTRCADSSLLTQTDHLGWMLRRRWRRGMPLSRTRSSSCRRT